MYNLILEILKVVINCEEENGNVKNDVEYSDLVGRLS